MRASPPTRQAPQSDHVVDREAQQQLGTQLGAADQLGLAQAANRLQPTKAFFDPLADLLAGGVPRVPRGAAVDGAALALVLWMLILCCLIVSSVEL